MALVFPTAPTVGQKYPTNPGISGVTQYQWDGTKWNAVTSNVSLGILNQNAYNTYKWPANDGNAGQFLQTDGNGNLSWT